MKRFWGLSLILIMGVLAGLFATNQAEAVSANLVAYWSFDEGEGSVAADRSGNGHDGVIHGAAYTPDAVRGSALEFGVGKYVDIPGLTSIPAQFTYELWVKPTDITAHKVFLVKDGGPDSNGYETCFAGLEWRQEGARICYGHAISFRNWGKGLLCAATPILANTWYHVAVTYDGTETKLYIDGVHEGTLPNGPPISSATAYQIGRRAAGDQWMAGVIDEVRIYNRALTAEEIKQSRSVTGVLLLGNGSQ